MDSVNLSFGANGLQSDDLVGFFVGCDLVCDDDVVPFYERLGGTRLDAVAWRNHDRLDAADG